MTRVLLAIKDPKLRKSLASWLAADYEVTLPDTGTLNKPFDLCLIAGSLAEAMHDWLVGRKAKAQPAYLPALLITTGDSLEELRSETLTLFDDVIMVPVNRTELGIRLRFHLAHRQLAADYEVSQWRLRRLNKALESISDGLMLLDTADRVIYLNPAFIRRHGFTTSALNEEGIAQTLFAVPQVAEEVLATLHQDHTWSGEVELKDRDGNLLPTMLRSDCIIEERPDGHRRIGTILVCTDITLRSQVEAFRLRQRLQAEALRDTAAILTSTLNLEEVFDRVLENVGRVLPYDVVNIMLEAEDTNTLRSVRTRWNSESPTSPASDEEIVQSVNAIENYFVARLAGELQTTSVVAPPPLLPNPGELSYSLIQSYLRVPIRLQSEVIGFLALGSLSQDIYQPEHKRYLEVFAEQTAIAIQNARLYEKAQTLAALEERHRLARNLHDAVSQVLFSASVIAETLPRLWERKPAMVKPRLEQLHELTRGALAEMRTLLMELRPDVLLDARLTDLLHQLAEAVRGRSRLTVSLEIPEQPPDLPAKIKVAFYYIVQEALNNIIKHARATTATITLQYDGPDLVLRIRDNGQGFDAATIKSTTLGMHFLQERAASIAANLSIASIIGQGTTVTVRWPSDHHALIRE